MKRCLIVDDSNVIRKVARRILQDMNFEISEAGNGEEALEHCRADMPDVILLDWHMPVMGAMEFLSAVKLSTDSAKRASIFYCTTENDPLDISQAIKYGASDFIMKPYDRASLEEKLGTAGLL